MSKHISTPALLHPAISKSNVLLLLSLQKSKLGQQIMVSHYLPMNTKTRDDKLPVVVYCHCNSGSRRDAEEAVWHLLPCGVGVVAFDFTVRACLIDSNMIVQVEPSAAETAAACSVAEAQQIDAAEASALLRIAPACLFTC